MFLFCRRNGFKQTTGCVLNKKAVDNLLKTRTLAAGWQEDATNWYLALAYLQLGKKVEAQTELQNIVKIGRDNVTRAEDILKKL